MLYGFGLKDKLKGKNLFNISITYKSYAFKYSYIKCVEIKYIHLQMKPFLQSLREDMVEK